MRKFKPSWTWTWTFYRKIKRGTYLYKRIQIIRKHNIDMQKSFDKFLLNLAKTLIKKDKYRIKGA